MDLTVYRQASKERLDGCVIYKGEDALPYVGENIFFVADGLGGASAIRHQTFNRDMFDREKLFDVLFNGVFEGTEDDDLRQYVIDSFQDFFMIADCYFDNLYNIKKSGFFGSHILSAIFLYLAKSFVGTISSQTLDLLSSKETAEQDKTDLLNNYSAYFTANIKEMLQKVSQNANLIYESSFTGLALLGTTLCATIVYEQSSYVDAIYFVAGDSRPYMWDKDGLRQVSADQERADGGMTNYIKANGDFVVNCEYRRFQKPCILFNATDGIFDSEYFSISQLALEKLLLETIVQSDTIEEVGKRLETIFVEYGAHDDSSTLALKTFGFENFGEIKDEAKNRLKQIEKNFLEPLPDLLEHNYIVELQNFIKDKAKRTKTLIDMLLAKPKVIEYCKQQIQLDVNGHNDYVKKFQELEECLSTYRTLQTQNWDELVCFIKDNIFIREPCQSYGLSEGYCYKLRVMTAKECKELAENLIAGTTAVDELNMSPDREENMNNLIKIYKDTEKQINDTEIHKESLIVEETKKYWASICESNDNILEYALSLQVISQEEYKNLSEQYPPVIEDEKSNIEIKANRQRDLLSLYDKIYFELIQGE